MIEFISEHWELFASLVFAVINLIITLVVHGKSSNKIENISGVSVKVSEALLSIAAINKEIQNEIKNSSIKGSKDLQKDCE